MELGDRPGVLFGRYVDPATGKRKTVKLTNGTDAKARAVAEEKLLDLIREARMRSPVSVEKRDLTLTEFLLEFMPPVIVPPGADRRAKRAARRAANEKAAVALDVGVAHARDLRDRLERAAVFFGAMPLAEIEKSHAEKFLAVLATEEGRPRKVTKGVDREGREITVTERPRMSPATRARYLAALSKCWEKAIDANVARVNPWRLVKAPKLRAKGKSRYVPRFLTRDEVERILEQLPDRMRPLFTCLSETGARLSEARELTWPRAGTGDDFRRVTFAAVAKEGESRYSREVDCSARAREILRDLRRRHVAPLQGPDYVFPHYERTYLWAVWQRACIAAGVGRGVRIRDLRHYVGSSLAQQGVPLSTVQKILGHRSARMTEIYASHVPTSATAAAFAAWDAARRDSATGLESSAASP